jgi:hypothetical protein
MTITEPLRLAIGTMLWRGSFSERRGIGVFGRLRRGALLTHEERLPLERIMDEEVDHGNLLRACAKRYIPARVEIRPAPYGPVKLLSEARLVATINAAERYETPGLGLGRAFFQRLGDADAVAAFDRLIADEPEHIAWSNAVLLRLRREHPEWMEELTAARRPLIAAYKAVRPERWFLHEATHA